MSIRYAISWLVLLALLNSHSARAQLTAVPLPDAPEQSFMLIENQQDNNRFIAGLFALGGTARLSGANANFSSKQTGRGYSDNGTLRNNLVVPNTKNIDMWEEGAIKYPYSNQHCFAGETGCNADSEPNNRPAATDEKGFYGSPYLTTQNQNIMAKLSDAYFDYLDTALPLNGLIERTMHLCATAENYDAAKGERCTTRSSGKWTTRVVKHRKVAHLTFIAGTTLSEIRVDSAGNAEVLPGSTGCERDPASGGILCRLVNYKLEGQSLNYKDLNLALSITNTALNGALAASDVKITANKRTWAVKDAPYPLNELKGSQAISVLLSQNFFKQIVRLKLTDQLPQNLFRFGMTNEIAKQSGFYEFNATQQLVITPRQHSVSIFSTTGSRQPVLEGTIGKDILSFPYHIVESGPKKADRLEIKLSQNTGSLHQGMCTFYPANITNQNRAIAIPTRLKFDTTARNDYQIPIRCDSTPIDLKAHNIKESQPSTLWPNPNPGITSFYRLNLEFDLTDNQTALTTTGQLWEGKVEQTGTLTLTGTWN